MTQALPLTLPGHDLVQQGMTELAAGRETVASLLVSIGAPRLRRLGLELADPIADPEHRLYLLLSRSHGDGAHSRYNALLRRLISFERSVPCAR
jgi:hypothetical protein